MMVEVASLFQLLGGMAPRHLTLIGGLVPPLLVPSPVPHHRGSGDIDLILSVAITKGETALYYKSLEERLFPFFEPFGSAFRWRKRDEVAGIPLLVDFMGPEIEATQIADGTIQPEDETASENVGSRLRPLPLRSAGVVDADPESKLIEEFPSFISQGLVPMSRSATPGRSVSLPRRRTRSTLAATRKTATTWPGGASTPTASPRSSPIR